MDKTAKESKEQRGLCIKLERRKRRKASLDDLKLERGLCITGCFAQGVVVCLAKDIDQIGFVGVDPGARRKRACGTVDALGQTLFEDNGDQTSEEALYEVEDVGDWWADFAHRVKGVAVEDHFPLDPAFWGEERTGVEWQTQLELWPCWKTDRRSPYGGGLKGEEHTSILGAQV